LKRGGGLGLDGFVHLGEKRFGHSDTKGFAMRWRESVKKWKSKRLTCAPS